MEPIGVALVQVPMKCGLKCTPITDLHATRQLPDIQTGQTTHCAKATRAQSVNVRFGLNT